MDPNASRLSPSASKPGPLDPTGLYHMGLRQLDPTTGSFLSPDPLNQAPSQPATSTYLFVGDQPTVAEDPSGACSVTEIIETYNNNQNVLYQAVGDFTGLSGNQYVNGARYRLNTVTSTASQVYGIYQGDR